MNASTHSQLAGFIWGICDLLRNRYDRNKYRDVILPFTVLRRFDCVLADTKQAVLAAAERPALSPGSTFRGCLPMVDMPECMQHASGVDDMGILYARCSGLVVGDGRAEDGGVHMPIPWPDRGTTRHL